MTIVSVPVEAGQHPQEGGQGEANPSQITTINGENMTGVQSNQPKGRCQKHPEGGGTSKSWPKATKP